MSAPGISTSNPIVVSTNNATTTPLGIGASYVGTADYIAPYEEVSFNLYAEPFNAQGTAFFEFSPNGVNWDVSVPLPVSDPRVFIPVPLRTILPYFRVRYTNGSVAQSTFRINVIFHRTGAKHLTRTPTQILGPQEPVEVNRSFIEPGFDYRARLLGADAESFGGAISFPRINQIAADFTRPLANNRVTSSVSGGGTTGQANGQATVTTGAAVTATARIESVKTVRYNPGRGLYAMLPARFTTPTHANSQQRIGLYNDSDGFFLGYQGTTFGFTHRRNAVDTFVPLTAANGDTLNATFLSRFSRNGLLEAINHTNFNVWRIRTGGHGAIEVNFDVRSPDANWLTVHTFKFPNQSALPRTFTVDVPVRMEVIKNNADATSLVVGSTMWAAGVEADPFGLEPYDVKSRDEIFATTVVAGAVAPVSVVVHTPNTGRRFRLTDVVMSVTNVLTTGGEWQISDGNGGTIKLRGQIAIATNQTRGEMNMSHHFKSPPGFTTNVFFTVPAIGVLASASINVYGYEEPI